MIKFSLFLMNISKLNLKKKKKNNFLLLLGIKKNYLKKLKMSSSSSTSSSMPKKTQNKIYTKEINNLIEKIIRSKKNTFRLTKVHSSANNQNNTSKGHINNLDHSSNKETEIKSVKITKQFHNKCLNQSGNSSMNDAVSISIINNNTNAKINDFNKQITECIANYSQNKQKCSNLISEILTYLKQENNLTSVIFDNEQFITNILELFSLINFSGLKSSPNYKVTGLNLEINPINNAVLEEIAFSANDVDSNGPTNSTMIRIKNESWKDILNLYDILITLLNNIPTISLLISKIPLTFISNLVASLNVLDNEERILIKILIYKIYISSLTYRKYILKHISNIIIDISHDEKSRLLCLNECLDLLNCILLGAKKPINESYLSIVSDVICPLLKCKTLFKQPVLKDTLVKLMNYDKNFLNLILSFLVRTWPVRYPERIILYLDIIENLFSGPGQQLESEIKMNDKILTEINEDVITALLKKIKCCFSDPSFLIADRSLVFFKNENFILLLYKYNLQKAFLSKLIENITKHWSQEIKIISRIVISKITKRDEKLMDCLTQKEKKIIDDFKFDMNESEDIWDVHFTLKGD